MTKKVTTVFSDDPLLKVAQLIFENNWDGLPVIGHDDILVGIITQYDLVTKGTNIHLPTFMQLFSQLEVYKKDKERLRPELQKIVSLTVKDVMNTDPMVVQDNTMIEEVARTFAEHHRVNPIPVVDDKRKVVGIISRYDLIKFYTGSLGTAEAIINEKSVDKKVDLFVEGFGKHFMLVSKFTPFFWKVVSILFIIVGFVIAMALIIRIEVNN